MNNYDTKKWTEYLMKIGNLNVGINMPKSLPSIGAGGEEMTHSLPPYHRRKAFLVDEYPACPQDWLRSSGRIKSYFVPIIEGNGLWLDFNKCLEDVPQHVAIVVSIQGVNAITGLPCKDPQLEQYRDECPKHKKAFGPDRLCQECGFKWPKQNYLASTGTPEGTLWLDGFRAEDGVIRQYVLTESKTRGVAKAIIGEDRVFALGVSFFLSKEKRPDLEPTVVRFCAATAGSSGPKGPAGPTGSKGAIGDSTTDWMTPEYSKGASAGSLNFMSLCDTGSPADANIIPSGPPAHQHFSAEYNNAEDNSTAFYSAGLISSKKAHLHDNVMKCSASSSAAPARNLALAKKLEIAAGARIDQRIYDDPFDLDYWQKEPDGIIVINYCTEQDAERILSAGKVDLSGSKEGFLTGMPVGNSI